MTTYQYFNSTDITWSDKVSNSLLLQTITSRGFKRPTINQRHVALTILSGRDVVVEDLEKSQRSITIAFSLTRALFKMDVRYQILVLEPTFQRANELHKMIVSVGGNISHLCVGGSKGMSYEAVPRISNAFFPIVVGTPGHLIDLMERKVLNPSRVGLVVLGETSALLNNKFGAHTADIFQRLTSKDVQFVYFSDIPVICADGQATSEYLKDPIRITIEKEQIETDGIEEQSLFVGDQDDDEVFNILCNLLNEHSPSHIVVYCNTQADAKQLSNKLLDASYSVRTIYRGMESHIRKEALERFQQNRFVVLVATDSLWVNGDVGHMNFPIIINYTMPMIDYMHYGKRICIGERSHGRTLAVNFNRGSRTGQRDFCSIRQKISDPSSL